jgi:hypothetical protein
VNKYWSIAVGFFVLSLGAVISCHAAEATTADDILKTLRTQRPRLLFTGEDQARIEKLAGENELLAQLIDRCRRRAEGWLPLPPSQTRRGHNFYSSCSRVPELALAWRLTGEERFATKAIEEMRAAAALPNWNHARKFLQTSQHAIAMAIGYDWLHEVLGEADRETIRRALIEKALKPGLESYAGRGKRSGPRWPKTHTNWNLVCNAGMVCGALAIADEEPEIAREILRNAIRSLPTGFSTYAPEGAYDEGPSYWDYGTTHGIMAIAALKTGLGSAFGLSSATGLDRTGRYWIHMIGPSGKYFNYADCNEQPHWSPTAFGLSREMDQPLLAWFYRYNLSRILAGNGSNTPRSPYYRFRDIIWFDERGKKPEPDELPLDALIRGNAAHGEVAVVAMRGAWQWDDPSALFVGVRSGVNDISWHTHRDIGSFVLDADGVRWVSDPGYGVRGAAAHSTLVIGKDQANKGTGMIDAFLSTPSRAHVVIDMSRAYKKQAGRVLRGIALLDRSRVLVQDEVSGVRGNRTVRWALPTPARITLDGSRATLTQNGRVLQAEILEPAGLSFTKLAPLTVHARKRTFTLQMLGIMMGISLEGTGPQRLAVLLTPMGKHWKRLPAPEIRPLAEWETQKLELPRFRGRRILWEKGVHDAEKSPPPVSAGVSAAEDRTGACRSDTGGTGPRV